MPPPPAATRIAAAPARAAARCPCGRYEEPRRSRRLIPALRSPSERGRPAASHTPHSARRGSHRPRRILFRVRILHLGLEEQRADPEIAPPKKIVPWLLLPYEARGEKEKTRRGRKRSSALACASCDWLPGWGQQGLATPRCFPALGRRSAGGTGVLGGGSCRVQWWCWGGWFYKAGAKQP